jgi:isopentenyl-diphosphate delta-isomerase
MREKRKMTMSDKIILVDAFDRQTGACTKEYAHACGKLHRAFSVFLYGSQGLLIQRRALDKYHSGGLWANTCCSHPRFGEDTLHAAQRRLKEETGITCEISERFSFVYYQPFSNGVTEYEYDHVFLGRYNGDVNFNPDEICEMCRISPKALHSELLTAPAKFASWFLIAAPRVLALMAGEGLT